MNHPEMGRIDQHELRVQFGNRVRQLRKRHALSQEGLALAANLDRSYIGGVERGERNISLNIHRIANALGVPPSSLFE